VYVNFYGLTQRRPPPFQPPVGPNTSVNTAHRKFPAAAAGTTTDGSRSGGPLPALVAPTTQAGYKTLQAYDNAVAQCKADPLLDVDADRKVGRRLRTSWRDVFHSRHAEWRASVRAAENRFSAEVDEQVQHGWVQRMGTNTLRLRASTRVGMMVLRS
jgi:hypothetical protein